MRTATLRRLESRALQWRRAQEALETAREARDRAIVAALREGAGVREVARLVGINAHTVIDVRDRAGGAS